jgi:hypothetical protein
MTQSSEHLVRVSDVARELGLSPTSPGSAVGLDGACQEHPKSPLADKSESGTTCLPFSPMGQNSSAA